MSQTKIAFTLRPARVTSRLNSVPLEGRGAWLAAGSRRKFVLATERSVVKMAPGPRRVHVVFFFLTSLRVSLPVVLLQRLQRHRSVDLHELARASLATSPPRSLPGTAAATRPATTIAAEPLADMPEEREAHERLLKWAGGRQPPSPPQHSGLARPGGSHRREGEKRVVGNLCGAGRRGGRGERRTAPRSGA